ncbi:protein abrupt-like isoform X2 [Macrobrachium nipponense]|uniref:protein abrupt-like isoform X2 n=1 Tax=Macrobrachium nipponense TaxID=159736 RepID=UPI0030C8D185
MNDLVMGADQFLLTWNNHRSNFAEVFTQLRVQDQLVDVTLLCDGGSYPAHRLVLAACSPYFHQLFTRLPTQHPLIYLRDVKQAELEALLEFIYRGEVSVANSELTGLIKIAESLRIKGLGDVSQRDQHPHPGEKRPSPPFSPSSPINHNSNPRPKKAARLSSGNGDSKGMETSFASLLSPANSYGHAINKSTNNNNHNNNKNSEGFAQLMDSGCPEPSDHDLEEDRTPNIVWDTSLSESKLRSCLEGLDSVSSAQTLAQSVAHTVAQSITVPRALFTSTPTKVSSARKEASDSVKEGSRGSSRRKHHEASESKRGRTSSAHHISSNSQECEKEAKIPKEIVKTEPGTETCAAAATTTCTTESEKGSDNPLLPMYDGNEISGGISDLANPLLASYRHMLGLSNEDRSYSPLIPTTVQEQQQAPSPTGRESRSLTCHLCGATIKHIANFRRHMKQHLNPRRFPCPWCSAAFGRKDNLKTHTRKHHPAEVEAQEAGVLQRGEGGNDGVEGSDDAKVALTGLNGLGSNGGNVRDSSHDDCDRVDGDQEDSSDHHESLVIAEDTEEEEEDDEDSRLQVEDGQ